MKFLTLCDYTGMVECELFPDAYRHFGIQTIRHPVLEITALVMPYENPIGFSLQVESVNKPRTSRVSQ